MTTAIFSLISFGLWGFLSKLAVQHLSPYSIIVYEMIGVLIVGVVTLFLVDFKPDVNMKGILLSIGIGICGTAGTLLFVHSIQKGSLSVVITMTSLYPLITIFLAYLFLGEFYSFKQILGIFFAILAIVLFAS